MKMSTNRTLSSFAVLALSSAWIPLGLQREKIVTTPSLSQLAQTAAQNLQLRQCEIVSINSTLTAESAPVVTISRGKDVLTLVLQSHSVRSPNFKLEAQLADGSYQEFSPGAVRTYRGTVIEYPESRVAASILENGLEARIDLSENETLWVEPIAGRVEGALINQYALYRQEDVIPSNKRCEVFGEAAMVPHSPNLGGAALGGSSLLLAQLALDADVEYFNAHDGSGTLEQRIANTVAAMETVINALNVTYETQVQITHHVVHSIVRTAEPDPYSSTNAGTLLNQFTSQWNQNHQNIPRDMTHLFTGKQIAGDVIGIAWLGGVCNNNKYSLVQSDCCGSAACRRDLSTHELGHNWNAQHCCTSGCEQNCSNNTTMFPSLLCANNFSTASRNQIIAYRDSRPPGCLSSPDILLSLALFGPAQVNEGTTVQITAIAQYAESGSVDVTSETSWHVLPPSAGDMQFGTGIFTADNVANNVSAQILASFSDLTGEADATLPITVVDTDLAILASDPVDQAIDARQPSNIDGSNPIGWQNIDITFDGDTAALTASDFTVTKQGGVLPAPSIIAVFLAPIPNNPGNISRMILSAPLEPGSRLTVLHNQSAGSVRLGYLPGDVNADGTASPIDILALIDVLNQIVSRPIWSTDINRSGSAEPSDILRVIDLLNGADAFAVWNNVSLP